MQAGEWTVCCDMLRMPGFKENHNWEGKRDLWQLKA